MSPAAVPARLLLIEDDASIRRFVELALEELPVALVCAGSLAEARAALLAGGLAAVISDLMLPDGRAPLLLQGGDAVALAARRLPWAVLSAGVSAQTEAELQALGVRQVLRKPVSLQALLTCAEGLLAQAGAAATPTGVAAAVDPGATIDPADAADGVDRPPDGADDRSSARAEALQQHFGGDAALFDEFRCGCLARFAADVAEGDAALSAADWPALRRVVHSLKSVLRLIGEPVLAQRSEALEHRLAAGGIDPASTAADWAPLAARLQALPHEP